MKIDEKSLFEKFEYLKDEKLHEMKKEVFTF